MMDYSFPGIFQIYHKIHLFSIFILVITNLLHKTKSIPFQKSNIKLKNRNFQKHVVIPSGHIDGLRLENGAANLDFLREILFGVNHDQIRPKSRLEIRKIMSQLISRADSNADRQLDQSEIAKLIHTNINQHLRHAKNDSLMGFRFLDESGSGKVSWSQYLRKFVQLMRNDTSPKTPQKKLNNNKQHNNDDDNNNNNDLEEKNSLNLTNWQHSIAPLFPQLHRLHRRWLKAADQSETATATSVNVALDSDQFSVFLHPELSHASLHNMALEIMEFVVGQRQELTPSSLKQKSSGEEAASHSQLSMSEEEFVSPGEGSGKDKIVVETPYPGYVNDDHIWVERQRQEFRKFMDANKDGRVDLAELERHIDPRSEKNAQKEAANLIQQMDTRVKNAKLDLEELVQSHDLVFGSRLFNVALVYHGDEL